jgi:hypothetical protein
MGEKVNAYVFVDCLQEKAYDIASILRKTDGVILADAINGPHNIIAVLQSLEAASLAKTVVFGIRKMKGVQNVTVYLAMNKEEIEKSKT